MVNFRLAFPPDGISAGGVLSDVAQQMAMAGKAFLLSAGLFTAEMDAAIGPEIDTAEDYNLITEAIRENREVVFERAATLSADATASDVMVMQATFGMLNPQGYGPYIDDYLTDTGFGSMDAETISEVVSLIGRFVEGAVGPAMEAREAPPTPGQEEYADYFIQNVALDEYPPFMRQVWEMSRQEDMTVTSAINEYIEQREEQILADYEAEHGEAMSPREQHVLRTGVLHELRVNTTDYMNRLTQLEVNLRDVPNIEVTPRDVAVGFARSLLEDNPDFHAFSSVVIEDMITTGDDFETAFERQARTYSGMGPSADIRGYAGIDNIRERIEAEVELITDAMAEVEAYESITIAPADAIRHMAEGWSQRTDLPNTPEHYIQYMEERIEFYQTNEGGSLDVQTASVRAALDARNQIDLDKGVPPRAIHGPNHPGYDNAMSLFEDSIRNSILVDQGHGLTEEQKEHYRSYARNPARADHATQLDYILDEMGQHYTYHREDALKSATEAAYQRAYAGYDPDAPAPTEPETAEPEAVTPPEEVELPEPSEFPFVDQDAFDTNNPFRLFATTEAMAEPGALASGVETVHYVLEHNAEMGRISIEEALEGLENLREEDGVYEIDSARVARIQAELGLEAGDTLVVDDPRLLEALAAYTNDTTVAELPQEWKDAFAREMLPAGADIPPVGSSFAEAAAAARSVLPELSTDSVAFETGVHDISHLVSESYNDFMATMPQTLSADQIQLNRAVVTIEGQSYSALDDGNLEEYLRHSYALTTLMAENAEEPMATELNDQAEQIREFADLAGVDVEPEEVAETPTQVMPRDPEMPPGFGAN